MKSMLLQEMQKIKEKEKTMGVRFQKPCYLFVQKYGRSVEAEMNEIMEMFGKSQYFSFKTEGNQKEETILRRFLMEQEKNAGLGRHFNGCVLIEISGEESDKEITDLLEYLEREKSRMTCIFTTKNFESVDFIKRQLEQCFFVRVIEGEEYDLSEQIDIFQNIINEYQFEIDKEAKKEVEDFFRMRRWQEKDMVEKRICNLANDILYRKMLEDVEEQVIDCQDVADILKNFELETGKKKQIGFVIGG